MLFVYLEHVMECMKCIEIDAHCKGRLPAFKFGLSP